MNKKDTGSFLGNIAGSAASGFDYANLKVLSALDEGSSLVLAPLEWIGLPGVKEARDYIENNNEITDALAANIRSRREKINRYANANPVRGVLLKPAATITEQVFDPVQTAINVGTFGTGFLLNAASSSLDYVIEEKLIYGRTPAEYGGGDVLNIVAAAGLGGAMSRFDTPDVGKMLNGEVIDNIKLDPMLSPLDKELKIQDITGEGHVDMKSQVEMDIRIESGQTASLPSKFYNGDNVSNTLKNVTTKLQSISSAYTSDTLNTKYGGEFAPENLDITKTRDIQLNDNLAETLKPVYTEISLGRKQATAEIMEELFTWQQLNTRMDPYKPYGDTLDIMFDDMDKGLFKSLAQGQVQMDDANTNLSKLINGYVTEAIAIKSKTDIVDNSAGYYIDTLNNKQELMKDLTDLFNNENLDDTQLLDYIGSQLKNIGNNVYINSDEAFALKFPDEGTYSIQNNPRKLIEHLRNDINATTKAIKAGEASGRTEYEYKKMFDVAHKWANMLPDDKAEFDRINNKLLEIEADPKINKAVTPGEIDFLKNYNKEVMDKFSSIFNGYEKKPREIMQDVLGTIIDERSGLNKYKELTSNLRNNNVIKGDVNEATNFLSVTMQPEMSRTMTKILGTYDNHLSAHSLIKSRKYSEVGVADAVMDNIKNTVTYHFLTSLNYLNENFANTRLVKNSAIKMGFNNKYSFIKSTADMMRLHGRLAKRIDSTLNADLASIADPFERMEVELFLRRIFETGYTYDKNNSFAKFNSRAAKVGAAGQNLSDVHRMVLAARFTSKSMYDKLSIMSFDEMSPMLRNLMKNNGIDDDTKLIAFKNEIRKYGSQSEFDKFILNADFRDGGKLKSVFEQMTDIMGREFEAFDKNLGVIQTDSVASKLWVNSNMMFKRYSMGAVSRAWKNLSTYYDSEDILRYRFVKNKKLGVDAFTLQNWKSSIRGTGLRSSSNFIKSSALTWGGSLALGYVHSKMYGGTDDERVKAKLEAMKTDFIPIVTEGITNGMLRESGIDILMGGRNSIYGYVTNRIDSTKRMLSASKLEPHEKIFWGIANAVSPSKISRGIDHIKFDRGVNPRITTISGDEQFLWSRYYSRDAKYEQMDGRLPIERAAEDMFYGMTDWFKFLKSNPKEVEEIAGALESDSDEAKLIYAAGVLELTESSMRQNHIQYAFAEDTPEAREASLQAYGMDYLSQLNKLTSEEKESVHMALSFVGNTEPMYIISALEEVTSANDRSRAILSLIDEDKLSIYEKYKANINKNKKMYNSIKNITYTDNTEGYIEFLLNITNI